MTNQNITTISIPKPLAEKIKKRCEDTGFNSVSSWVTFVLRQLLSGMEQKTNKEPITRAEEQHIKDRLHGLGYLK
jgi:Arc/MetJ-type ribon-helix-helix transcriptional regulator